MISTTFPSHVTRDTFFEEKARWLFSTLFFPRDQYLWTKFCKTCHWSIITSSSYTPEQVALAESLKGTLYFFIYIFQLKDIVYISLFCCMKVTATVKRRNCKCSTGGAFLWYSMYSFIVVRVICFDFSRAQEWISFALNGCKGTQRELRWEEFHPSSLKYLCYMVLRETSTHHLSRCTITWSEWNLPGLTASPLDLLGSTRSLWSWPIEVVNCRGATINCLPCAALTCLSVGPSALFGDKTAIWVCVLLCCRGVVLGSLCNLVRCQLQLATTTKRKRENKMKRGKCHLSISHCYVLHVCQNRRAKNVNNADNCLPDRFRGGSSTSYHAA